MKSSSPQDDLSRLIPHEPKIYVLSSLEETQLLIHNRAADLKDITDIIRFASLEKAHLDAQMHSVLRLGAPHHFARSNYAAVRDFFDEASTDYDSDLKNPYWAFTHEILKFILRKFITEHFRKDQAIRAFDAGTGTGNWSEFILSLNERISGTLFDMNLKMLRMAHSKIARIHGNLVKIVEGNLECPTDFPSERCNLILCMHNVIGLGRNTALILKNLCGFLEEGGIAFIMAPNKYHAFNFTNQFRKETEVLRVLQDGTVKFKPDMPEMFCYTPPEFKAILHAAGFKTVTVLGFPVTVYPSPKDTKLLRKDTSEQQLTNPAARAMLLDLEKRFCLDPELAYRGGSSLLAICKKKST